MPLPIHTDTPAHLMEAKTISIEASDKLELSCGASYIELLPGEITISSPMVYINPDAAAADEGPCVAPTPTTGEAITSSDGTVVGTSYGEEGSRIFVPSPTNGRPAGGHMPEASP